MLSYRYKPSKNVNLEEIATKSMVYSPTDIETQSNAHHISATIAANLLDFLLQNATNYFCARSLKYYLSLYIPYIKLLYNILTFTQYLVRA